MGHETQGAESARRLAAMPIIHGRKPLGRMYRGIIRALAEVVLPLGEGAPPADLDAVAVFVARYTCFMPRLLQIALPMGLITLQLGAFFLAPSLVPFSRMSLDRRRRYVNGWVHSRLRLFRDLIKGMKGICYLAYYSDPAVHKFLEYTPEEHVALVKQERLVRHAQDI